MNVKYDLDKNKRPKYQQYPPPYPNYPYQGYPPPRQPQMQQSYPNYLPPNPPVNNPVSSEQIVGTKNWHILVR